VFSNRFYRCKLAAALTLAALLGVYAGKRGESINPMLWRCLAQPERWNNERLWIPRAYIVEVRETSYVIRAGEPEGRIRVDGPAPGKPGDLVSVIGSFRSGGPRLEQDRSRVFLPQFHLRWLVEAISIVVALAVLLNFSRHFLFRPKLLQVEGDPHA
jgi:hypothetical protein